MGGLSRVGIRLWAWSPSSETEIHRQSVRLPRVRVFRAAGALTAAVLRRQPIPRQPPNVPLALDEACGLQRAGGAMPPPVASPDRVHRTRGQRHPVAAPGAVGEARYVIGVKLERDSKGGSTCLHETVREGDVLVEGKRIKEVAKGLAASQARMTRSSALEVLYEDYVRTARAKGLSDKLIVWRHVFRNALLPVITTSGLALGGLLGGAVSVERAFGVPGLGTLLVQALNDRDWMMIQNLVLRYGVIFAVINLLVDLSYAWFDPRIRYE